MKFERPNGLQNLFKNGLNNEHKGNIEHHTNEHDRQSRLHYLFTNGLNNGHPKMRIRKDVTTLNEEEKEKLTNALQQAMRKKNNGMMYMDLANYHAAPYTICPYPGCCPHGTKRFLTWHRLYTGL